MSPKSNHSPSALRVGERLASLAIPSPKMIMAEVAVSSRRSQRPKKQEKQVKLTLAQKMERLKEEAMEFERE